MIEPKISITFTVGHRYRCTVAVSLVEAFAEIAAGAGGGLVMPSVTWEPEPPGRLSDAEMVDYRRGRKVLAAEMARVLGDNAIVFEPSDDGLTKVEPAEAAGHHSDRSHS
jgi:hypothetical protein